MVDFHTGMTYIDRRTVARPKPIPQYIPQSAGLAEKPNLLLQPPNLLLEPPTSSNNNSSRNNLN